jgi:hypothetical protein
MTNNPLWDVIQNYMDEPKHRYPPKPADLARETGISEQVLSKWKAKPVLPQPIFLLAFSAGTGIPYSTLLTAALHGTSYLFRGDYVSTTQALENALGGDPGKDLIARVRAGAPRPHPDLTMFGVPNVSDAADTPYLAAANEGDIEESGEF